jgi:hypothetical protein
MRESTLLSTNSRVCIVVMNLLLAFSVCLRAESPATRTHTGRAARASVGRHLVLKGVRNFGEVTPMLYRGGQPTPAGFRRLARMGIQIVVDTGRSKRDKRQIQRLGMRYVSLPWFCPFPKDAVFVRFMKLVRENPDKKIFVHCRLGDDRTGMMIASYRMGVQGWTAEEAMKEMQYFGYTTVHHAMCPGLARYERSFPERLRKSRSFRAAR